MDHSEDTYLEQIMPVETGEVDNALLSGQELTERPFLMRAKKFGRTVIEFLAIYASVSTATSFGTGKFQEYTNRPTDQQVTICNRELTEDLLLPLHEIRSTVASMKFSLSQSEYQTLLPKLQDATNIEEATHILNEPLLHTNSKFILGKAPGILNGLLIGSDDDAITLEEIKSSGNNFLLALSQIPKRLLLNKEIRLGKNLGVKESPLAFYKKMQPVSGAVATNNPNTIYLDVTEFMDKNGEGILFHELIHSLMQQICGQSGTYLQYEPMLDRINGLDFEYGHNLEVLQKLYDDKKIVSGYAGTAPDEDLAETGLALFFGDLDHENTVTQQKMRLIASRLETVEPNIMTYFWYKSYIGNQAFPKEVAAQQNAYYECFGVLNPSTSEITGEGNTLTGEVANWDHPEAGNNVIFALEEQPVNGGHQWTSEKANQFVTLMEIKRNPDLIHSLKGDQQFDRTEKIITKPDKTKTHCITTKFSS